MTSNELGRRLRITASATLIAVGASVASIFGATAPANAAPDAFVAIASGLVNDNPPVQTIGGVASGPDESQVFQAALTDCVNRGGHQCVVQVKATNSCVAIAATDFGEVATATDPSLQGARAKAPQNLAGSHLVQSGCSNGQGAMPNPPPPSAPPSQPPAPKLGPTVTFKTIIGGLQAHITDRSGVASQCTYVTDDFDRSFALPANSSYDLKIVPAVPRFRNWNVTITCDNGTTTQATTYF